MKVHAQRGAGGGGGGGGAEVDAVFTDGGDASSTDAVSTADTDADGVAGVDTAQVIVFVVNQSRIESASPFFVSASHSPP